MRANLKAHLCVLCLFLQVLVLLGVREFETEALAEQVSISNGSIARKRRLSQVAFKQEIAEAKNNKDRLKRTFEMSMQELVVKGQIQGAQNSINFSHFNWQLNSTSAGQCMTIHEGSMKIVCRLASHPSVALVSVMRGSGKGLLDEEIGLLRSIRKLGIRTVAFHKTVLEVPHFNQNSETEVAAAYLVQYLDRETCFFYEEGEPETEDYFAEPMRKLKLLDSDDGDWAMNRDVIQTLNHKCADSSTCRSNFMQDLTMIVKAMLETHRRIVDFQGVLGKDGHFYVADPLKLRYVRAVNRYMLSGVYTYSDHPQRQNKPKKAAFVEGLGMDLGVFVPDVDIGGLLQDIRSSDSDSE